VIIFQLTILHNNVEVSVFTIQIVVLTTHTYFDLCFFFPKKLCFLVVNVSPHFMIWLNVHGYIAFPKDL